MSNLGINTYSQIHLQFVFAVKFRNALINLEWKENLHKYITGTIQNKKHKMIAINTMPDHLHILIGFRPYDCISELIRVVKAASQDWVNENHLTRTNFEWQNSFGAFSYSKTQLPNVIAYIENQEEHHRQKSFLTEYIELLELFEIEYVPRYLFKELV